MLKKLGMIFMLAGLFIPAPLHADGLPKYSPDKNTALLQAIENNDFESVRRLVEEEGADVNYTISEPEWPFDVFPLTKALQSGNARIFTYLAYRGARGPVEWYDLREAIQHGYFEAVQAAMNGENFVEKRIVRGALHSLAGCKRANEFAAMANLLVKNGADVNYLEDPYIMLHIMDGFGMNRKMSVLEHAVLAGNAVAVDWLLSNGADPRLEDHDMLALARDASYKMDPAVRQRLLLEQTCREVVTSKLKSLLRGLGAK